MSGASPHLLAALTGVQVGAALVASAAVVDVTGPAGLALLRYAIAALLLLPFAWAAFRRGPPMTGRDLVPVALLGVGQFGALIWLLNLAVARAAPSRVALVFAALPILTAALAVLLGRGWPTRRTALGIAAGTAGVAILLGGAATGTAPGSAEPLGLLLALGGTMIAALCSLLYRPHLVRYGVLRVSVVAMLASLAPLAVLTVREPAAPLGGWDARSVGLVGFVGASSAVGYLMWLGALARLDAAVVTAFLALSPVTAAGLSAAAFGTSLTATDLAAMGLVAGSLLSLALPVLRPPAQDARS